MSFFVSAGSEVAKVGRTGTVKNNKLRGLLVYSHLVTTEVHSDRNCNFCPDGLLEPFVCILCKRYLAAAGGSTASLKDPPRMDRSGWGRSVMASKAWYWDDFLSWNWTWDADPPMFYGRAMAKSWRYNMLDGRMPDISATSKKLLPSLVLYLGINIYLEANAILY